MFIYKEKRRKNMKITNIVWDVDCQEDLLNLPTEVEVPDKIANEGDDAIGDWLSDTYGFCYDAFYKENDVKKQ